jgi:hypothetical protein
VKRRVFTVVRLVGAAAVLGALLALWLPLQLGAVDRSGAPIACGTGFSEDLTVAQRIDVLNATQRDLAGPGFLASDYAGGCSALISERRMTALTVAGAGVVLILATFADAAVVAAQRAGRRSDRPGWANSGWISSHPA